MADEILQIDENGHACLGGLTNDASLEIRNLRVDPSTNRLLVDVGSISITNNAEHEEDAAFSNGATGLLGLGVRQDADTSPVTTDGDYHAFIFNNAGALKVAIKSTVGLTDTELRASAVPVSLATVPSHAVTNAGTFAVQVDGAALTALQLIDNLVLAEDLAHQSADPGIQMLAVRDDTLDIRSGAENDYEPLHTNANGALWSIDVNSSAALTALQLIDNIVPSINGPGAPTIDSYTKVTISGVTGTDQALISAPGASKQIWVYGIGFTTTLAGTVAFQDDDNTTITGVMNYAQYSGLLINPSGNFAMPIWKLPTNKALEVDVVTATINGWISYAIVSV